MIADLMVLIVIVLAADIVVLADIEVVDITAVVDIVLAANIVQEVEFFIGEVVPLTKEAEPFIEEAGLVEFSELDSVVLTPMVPLILMAQVLTSNILAFIKYYLLKIYKSKILTKNHFC